MSLKIYILELSDDKWYVGKTHKTVKARFEEHLSGKGSFWTRKYKPIKIKEIISKDNWYGGPTWDDENYFTKQYMGEYGVENVRGGSYCNLKLTEEQLQYLYLVTTISNFIEGGKLDYYLRTEENLALIEKYEAIEAKEQYNLCYVCNMNGHYAKDCVLNQSSMF